MVLVETGLEQKHWPFGVDFLDWKKSIILEALIDGVLKYWFIRQYLHDIASQMDVDQGP